MTLFDTMLQGFGTLALSFRSSLESFCDIETSRGPYLVSRQGDLCSVIKLLGVRRICSRSDVETIAGDVRRELSSAFDGPGHCLQMCFTSDPSQAAGEIEMNLAARRVIARGLHADFEDILAERARVLPRYMRWEAAHLVLWSRPSLLSKTEAKEARLTRSAEGKSMPAMGVGMADLLLGSDELESKHAAFVQTVRQAFESRAVTLREMPPHEAVATMRGSIYPDARGDTWRPMLPGDAIMPSLHDGADVLQLADIAWPAVREQLFSADAETLGPTAARIGQFEWAPVDLSRGPGDPRPFAELAARLSGRHIPWRASFLIEGAGPGLLGAKSALATMLNFGANKHIKKAFDGLRAMREEQTDIAVRLRANFATWAPDGETKLLRKRVAQLHQGIEVWGDARAAQMSGDPLEATLSSVPALAIASTAPASAAPLKDVLTMCPWARPGSPWEDGSVVFRTPDGALAYYDPAGSGRKAICDLFVAPSRYGKSVLSNTLLLGTILSNAAQTTDGIQLPLIGKLDIGESAEGLIDLVRQALPPRLRHQAVYCALQLEPGFEYNILDTQVGCRRPLRLDREFIANFVALACMPQGADAEPFEGMDQLTSLVIDEAYRRLGDEGPNTQPRPYRRGMIAEVDTALAHLGIGLPDQPTWWDVVDACASRKEWRAAELANRHAVPRMIDLISAARDPAITQQFTQTKIVSTESVIEAFQRYMTAFVTKYPTLNQPTKLEFGGARIIVIDLRAVAPQGSDEAERQTDLMYLLGRQILARNFFLHPRYADDLPVPVREHHRKRFAEAFETFKRLEYDEYHRTKGRRHVRAQVELDRREGAKHNLHLGFSSQKLEDFGDDLIAQSSARFILGAGDEDERETIIKRFRLSPSAAEAVRSLNGPRPDGSGAPFLMLMNAHGQDYEQLLLNVLGPIELWALSTTPDDTALRGRLYDCVGPAEARRRLARVFPKGTAAAEIKRRKDERVRRGEELSSAAAGVVAEIADELMSGRGLGVVIRDLEGDV